MHRTAKRLFAKASTIAPRNYSTPTSSSPPKSNMRMILGGVAAASVLVAAFSMFKPKQSTPGEKSEKKGDAKQQTPAMEKSSVHRSSFERDEKLNSQDTRTGGGEKGESLVDNFITPNRWFFKRNFNPDEPTVDDKQFKLQISGVGIEKTVGLSLEELRTKFTPHSVTVTLNCGKNRGNGLISTAKFTGVWLRDIIQYAGISKEGSDDKFVTFQSIDKKQPNSNYVVSLPLPHVLNPRKDVLLAFEMNGEKIPIDNGYPLRLIVPGSAGSRNVKWLNRIKLTEEPTDIGYLELPVNSSICVPSSNAEIHGDKVNVKGWAYSGGGRSIIRVDLTADGGKTWHEAELINDLEQEDGRAWAWTRWHANLELNQQDKGQQEIEICSKAIDSSYNAQPEKPDPHVTLVAANNWHCVKCRKQ